MGCSVPQRSTQPRAPLSSLFCHGSLVLTEAGLEGTDPTELLGWYLPCPSPSVSMPAYCTVCSLLLPLWTTLWVLCFPLLAPRLPEKLLYHLAEARNLPPPAPPLARMGHCVGPVHACPWGGAVGQGGCWSRRPSLNEVTASLTPAPPPQTCSALHITAAATSLSSGSKGLLNASLLTCLTPEILMSPPSLGHSYLIVTSAVVIP